MDKGEFLRGFELSEASAGYDIEAVAVELAQKARGLDGSNPAEQKALYAQSYQLLLLAKETGYKGHALDNSIRGVRYLLGDKALAEQIEQDIKGESPQPVKETLAAQAFNTVNTQAPEADGLKTYKIKSGDSLSLIASIYNTTVERLQEINGIEEARLIYAGKNIQVPDIATPALTRDFEESGGTAAVTPVEAVSVIEAVPAVSDVSAQTPQLEPWQFPQKYMNLIDASAVEIAATARKEYRAAGRLQPTGDAKTAYHLSVIAEEMGYEPKSNERTTEQYMHDAGYGGGYDLVRALFDPESLIATDAKKEYESNLALKEALEKVAPQALKNVLEKAANGKIQPDFSSAEVQKDPEQETSEQVANISPPSGSVVPTL